MAIILSAILLGIVTAAIYAPGLGGGFFFDDGPSILAPEGVRMTTLSIAELADAWASGRAGPTGRPISQLSFALNHYVTGYSPFAFKLVNLGIHLLCGLLVALLGHALLGALNKPMDITNRRIVALLIAAAWILHPIHVTTVLHAVQRMMGLATLFLLAALWLHVSARPLIGRTRWTLVAFAWLVCWPLAFLSKETGFLFPALVACYEAVLRRPMDSPIDLAGKAFLIGFAATATIVLAYFALTGGAGLLSGYSSRDFDAIERLMTQARVLMTYAGQIIAPQFTDFGLYHDDLVPSRSLLDPWTTLPAITAVAIAVVAVGLLRNRVPAVSFGIAFFLVGHSLESTILPLELMHEHRNYLPSFGLMFAASPALGWAASRRGIALTTTIAVAAAWLAHATLTTSLRSHQFGDDIRRTQVETQNHPGSARAHYDAGRAYLSRPHAVDPDNPLRYLALRHFEQATLVNPHFKFGLLGSLYGNCPQPPPRDVVLDLAARLRDTPFAPGDINVLEHVGSMEVSQARCLSEGDVTALFRAAQANPTLRPDLKSLTHQWLAVYHYRQSGDTDSALAELTQAVTSNPGNVQARLLRAEILIMRGAGDAARSDLAAAATLNKTSSQRARLDHLSQCLSGPNRPLCQELK